MNNDIKISESEEGAVFEIDYNEENLRIYSDDYFKNHGIEATISLVMDKNEFMKGGNTFFEDNEEEKTLTVPYRYFYYRAKVLTGNTKTDNDSPDNNSKNSSVFVDFFKTIPSAVNSVFEKIKELGNSIYSKPVEIMPVNNNKIDNEVLEENSNNEKEFQVEEKSISDNVVVEESKVDSEESKVDTEQPILEKKIKIKVNSNKIKKVDKNNLSYKELGIILNTISTLEDKLESNNIQWERGVYIIENKRTILTIGMGEKDELSEEKLKWEGSGLSKSL
jgi:hypothetical protein